MLKKNLSIIFIILFFVIFSVFVIFFIPLGKEFEVSKVISPTEFFLEDKRFVLEDLETFDSNFSLKNKKLAELLKISETEAFILGNLSKNWALNLMKGRKVLIKENDLIYYKYSYRTKFLYSGFCLVDSKPYNDGIFQKRLKEARYVKYKIIDLDSDEIYDIEDEKVQHLKNFILIRKSHIPKNINKRKNEQTINKGDVKVFFTDYTEKYIPDRKCSTNICREILKNINNAQKTIDIAIYGYSSVPKIEEAINNAIKRGVKIRLVFDEDEKGKNIYPNTKTLLTLIKDNKSDGKSIEAKSLMHNKFYIFDDKILITGSANLSHTDMSGFNTNSIVVINSEEVTKIYKTEFEQMFNGHFHTEKVSQKNKKFNISGVGIEVYFSPQDKSITNAILPLIRNAKKYVYVPTFVLTEKRVAEELIKAKSRGVDVKVIADAVNASMKYSKHNELRLNGVLVKTENYAGKMHSKSMIIDDEYTIIGSMNFSNSGENRNDENLVLIKDSDIARLYKEFFVYQWNKIDEKWLKFNVRAEGKDSIGSCFDGLDNNYDGLTDSEDLACK